MSSISFCSGSSNTVTGSARRRRTSLPYLTMGRTAKSTSPFFQALDHRFDGVLRASLVKLVENFADPRVRRQRGRFRSGDRRGARLACEHADFAEEFTLSEFRQIHAPAAPARTARVDLHL